MEESRKPISRMRGGFFYFLPDAGIIKGSSVEGLGRLRIGRKDPLTPMGRLGKAKGIRNSKHKIAHREVRHA